MQVNTGEGRGLAVERGGERRRRGSEMRERMDETAGFWRWKKRFGGIRMTSLRYRAPGVSETAAEYRRIIAISEYWAVFHYSTRCRGP